MQNIYLLKKYRSFSTFEKNENQDCVFVWVIMFRLRPRHTHVSSRSWNRYIAITNNAIFSSVQNPVIYAEVKSLSRCALCASVEVISRSHLGRTSWSLVKSNQMGNFFTNQITTDEKLGTSAIHLLSSCLQPTKSESVTEFWFFWNKMGTFFSLVYAQPAIVSWFFEFDLIWLDLFEYNLVWCEFNFLDNLTLEEIKTTRSK